MGWGSGTYIFSISNTNNGSIPTVFENLFSVLSTWDPNSELALDISIYSPSDSKHWFKYLTFVPDTASHVQTILDKVDDDPQHGWVAGFRHRAPLRVAIYKVFHPVMRERPFEGEESEYQCVILRQQNRRRWKPGALAHMFAHFLYLFDSIPRFNTNLKRLVVFENFNQQYPAFMQRFYLGEDVNGCDSIRNPSPAVSRMVALASLKLEHLAASFIVDASHFFEKEPSWEWPNLTSLVITSKLLAPNENPVKIGSMLQTAAAAAMKMPQLETMEIWNGRKGLAALFKYHAFRNTQQARITWRGTWELTIEPSTMKAWEAVVNQRGGWRLDLVQERLDKAAIQSHSDAIYYLMLSN
ncbi:hypothetical protein F5Y08DRAFT_326046 [Xylaria arbuscula]|nr:hypothetical protein F5Y08DRAFT_326046 [Xylaria arbuscula]